MARVFCIDQTSGTGVRFQRLIAMSVLPLTVCCVAVGPVKALSTNSEAASPQRTLQSASRQTTQPARSPQASRIAPQSYAAPINNPNDGIPDQSWGGPSGNVPAPSLPPALVRQVTIPVLGREGASSVRAAISAQRPQAPSVASVVKPSTTAPLSPTIPLALPSLQPTLQAGGVRQISINASEPTLTSIVRPQDVASFQKIGAPYQVAGTWYVPAHEPNYDETGAASWYGEQFQGKPTANGEIFDMNVVSGAHPTLPIPSLVEVTNLTNGRSIVVRINDRGPFVGNRLIDLSSRGAELLGFREQGHTNVRVRYVGPANAEPVVTADNISTGRASVVLAQNPMSTRASEGFIQVGAFSQRANAERLAEQSAGAGTVRVTETTLPDGSPLFRVELNVASSSAIANNKTSDLSLNSSDGARAVASLY